MSCKLDKMWEMQAEQQASFNMAPGAMGDLDRDQNGKDLALNLFEEVRDLAALSTHYKAHILRRQRPHKLNVAEAVADVLKLTIAMAQLGGLTAAEVFEAYQRKTNVVADRARGERLALERDTKVFISDLDGCIADLSGWENEMKRASGDGPMSDYKVKMLEALKEDFYRAGGFKDLPAIPRAAAVLAQIKAAGFNIVIITARPAWQYKRLYGDTIEWLARHNIPHDLILFNKDKAEAIYENILPARPRYFVEDREKHAIELANIGVPVLFMGPANVPERPLVKKVADWDEIAKEVLG